MNRCFIDVPIQREADTYSLLSAETALQGFDKGSLANQRARQKKIEKPYAEIAVGRDFAEQKLAKPHVRFMKEGC